MNALVTKGSSLAVYVAVALLAGCYVSERPRAADTNTSWLQTGRELPGSRRELPPVPPMAPMAMVTTTTSPSGNGPLGRFDDEGRITLSDPSEIASAPRARFVDGHFDVVWSASFLDRKLELAELSSTGVAHIYKQQPSPLPSERFVIAEDGRVGALPYGDADVCPVQFLEPRLIAAHAPMAVDCSAESIAFAPIPGSREWVIVNAGGQQALDQMFIGRYDTGTQTWTVPSRPMGPIAGANELDVTVRDDDAVVVFGNDSSGSQLVVVPGFARLPTATLGEPSAPYGIAGAVHSSAAYNFARLDDRLLVFGDDDSSLWAAVVSDALEDRPIAKVAPTGVVDSRPGVAVAPELGLAGVCYGTGTNIHDPTNGHDGVAFALIDSDGRLAGEPRVLVDGAYNIKNCDVAWSGEEFLVVWSMLDSDSAAVGGVVRGQRFRP